MGFFIVRVLTDIGEIGVSTTEREYLFRPSLYAMSQLGTPAEIVKLFAFMFGGGNINPYFQEQSVRAHSRDMFRNALTVLTVCCDEDISPLSGCMGERWGSYRPGLMPMDDVIPLARSLLRHGIVGALPADKSTTKAGDYTPEFSARDYVAMGMAHLGLSESEAWDMTMTSLTAAMRSKYPANSKSTSGAPTESEHDATMSWLEKVNAARSKGNK